MTEPTPKYSEGNTRASESKKKPEQKIRNWVFTLFSNTEDPPQFTDHMKWLAYGSEICPDTGRHHWQGMCGFKNAKTFSAAKKYFGDNRHIASMRGSLQDNEYYCSKESKLIWHGDKPDQGKRNDLAEITAEILAGTTNVEQILVEKPMTVHQYGRTLDRIQDMHMRNVFRTEMTEGIWLYGPTGSGKSHNALKDFSPKTHYIVPNDGGWWDGYRQQETVVIQEFRGGIPFETILEMVDKWPFYVKRRGKEPMSFTSKKVIITSPLSIEQCWPERKNERDNINQMLRRFNQIALGAR